MGFVMDDSVEIIAVVLGDASERRWHAGQLGRGAQRLVRRPDGRVALEPVASEEQFEQTALDTMTNTAMHTLWRGVDLRQISREMVLMPGRPPGGNGLPRR